jgi:hypothetical protein
VHGQWLAPPATNWRNYRPMYIITTMQTIPPHQSLTVGAQIPRAEAAAVFSMTQDL